MHIYGIFLLLTLSAFHSSSDAAEENLASNNLESQHNVVAPSRVKRQGMNILRLSRTASAGGFPNDYPQYQDQDRDDVLALEKISEELQSPYLNEISPSDYYQALNSLQDSYSHSRYRRSTPADDMMVTPVPLVDDSGADGLKIDENDDDSYFVYQDLADDDSVVVDDDGKAWDVKTGEELSKRGLNMLRLGKRDNRNTKRLNMLRLGKRESDNEKRNMNTLRLGKRQMESFNSEFGAPSDLSSLGQDSKRFPMLRVGKRESEDEKRNLNMLRLGKRQMNMLRLGKRQMNMLRLGKRQMNMLRLGKRQLNMLRLGKRQLNMLRLGKREDADDNTAAKRNLQMLRLGKRQEDDVEKRNLHMLRLGKRSVENAPVNKAE